jgi:two-component system, sensor histidine kinase and response regulator
MAMSRADAGWPSGDHPGSDPVHTRPGLLGRLFHETAEAMAVVGLPEGRVLEVNEAFVALSEISHDELVGASSFDLGLWADLGDEGTARATLCDRNWIEDLMAAIVTDTHIVSMRISAEIIAGSGGDDPIVLVRATVPGAFTHSSERFRVLRDAEARYRSLVEQLPAIVYTQVADRNASAPYRDVYVSRRTEEKLGYSAAEWQADPLLWRKLTYIEDLDSVLREQRLTDDGSAPFSSVYRMVARDGRVLWFRDDAVLVPDPETGLATWKGVMLDITEQKHAEEQRLEAEARYRALVERLPAIVYHSEFSTEGAWLYVSPQVEEIFGMTPQEWMDHPHPMASFCHPDDIARVRDTEEHSRVTGEMFRADYRMRTPSTDGWRWFHDEAAVVRGEDGRPLHMLGVMFDLTQRKQAEDAVREALGREKKASDRLRVLDILKNTLLHTLSHDLKTPLTAIHTAAATIDQLGHELSEDQHRDLLRTIMTRARKMDELLSDLLDLDRLDRGIIEPRLEDEDLGDLVRRVVEDSDAVGGRPVHIDADPLTIPVDRTKVERILENLLSNVARHTPRGTPVWISVVGLEDGAVIMVDDEGQGVSDDLKAAVFDEFRRGPDAREGGSGIGLSLVARFASLHGGRAWVEDRPGGGSSFRVFLAASRPDERRDGQSTISG